MKKGLSIGKKAPENGAFSYFFRFYNKCWGGEKEIYKKESTYSECLL